MEHLVLQNYTFLPPQAVHNVNNLIAPEIVAKCMDPVEQEKIDQLMVSSQRVIKLTLTEP